MANSKVSSLTASDALAGTELFYADGLAGAAAADVKVTATQIKTWTSASPTLVTPALGTPSAGVLSSCSAYPQSSLTGLGTGVSTALGIAVGSAGAPVTNGGALGSPSSAGTIPAYTLGGTVAGGGNQINNVVIGTTTPLAGTFTTVSFSPTTGGIVGTVSADNPTTGKVGELLRSSSGETGLGSTSATITVTIATPGVMTWGTTIPFTGNAPVNFTTTGALPTGLVAGTTYYTIGSTISGNTCQLATSLANAIAGTAINTSGTQSGVHTGIPTAILTSAATKDIAAISLSAGDWEVYGEVAFLPAGTTSVTLLRGSLNTTSVTSSTIPSQWAGWAGAAEVPGANESMYHIGPQRFNVSGATTVFVNALTLFSVAGLQAWGAIRARRVR